jgi:hypothetical protein
MWRALPYYKKEILAATNMVVATMTEQEWLYYVKSLIVPPMHTTFRSITMPDHSKRRPEVVQTCDWVFPNLPFFSFSDLWFFKKWFVDEIRYRARICNFGLIRNTWSGVVRVKFEYKTWFYSLPLKTWVEI